MLQLQQASSFLSKKCIKNAINKLLRFNDSVLSMVLKNTKNHVLKTMTGFHFNILWFLICPPMHFFLWY